MQTKKVDIKKWAYDQAQELGSTGVIPMAAAERIIDKIDTHYKSIIHMIEESKKCRECGYLLICPWSRGEDDAICGKFVKLESE